MHVYVQYVWVYTVYICVCTYNIVCAYFTDFFPLFLLIEIEAKRFNKIHTYSIRHTYIHTVYTYTYTYCTCTYI